MARKKTETAIPQSDFAWAKHMCKKEWIECCDYILNLQKKYSDCLDQQEKRLKKFCWMKELELQDLEREMDVLEEQKNVAERERMKIASLYMDEKAKVRCLTLIAIILLASTLISILY